MRLADEGEALAYDVAFSLANEHPALPELESRARDVARKLRALAIIVLLTRADVGRFRGNLQSAAELQRDYLRAAQLVTSPKLKGREFAAGRCAGLFDALAAGALGVAREIVALSPVEWRPDCEYEDDFCWARLVGLMLHEDRPAQPEAAALLDRFEACLQGHAAARLPLARALVRRSAETFGPAFEALLEEHSAQIDERIDAGEMDDTVVLAERRLFVEGLGLLALADWMGLPTEREYLFCPSIGRVRLGTDDGIGKGRQ